MKWHDCDPKGLIFEAYRIEGIDDKQCRTIFLDWALGRPEGEAEVQLAALIEAYAMDAPDHPMTAILREGMATLAGPRKRGARSGASARRQKARGR